MNSLLVEDVQALQNMEPTGDGAYVYVKRTSDRITIKQDFVGSYGLYLFREGDYFALSNSFMMLVDYVKKDHRISFNRDFANSFLVADLCAVAYSETLVNEIEMLDRCAVVEINLQNRQMDISYFDYEENTVELHSEEGLRILDSWYRKWTAIIGNLEPGDGRLRIDLSGGFDSRLTFSLLLGSGLDLNRVYVNSIEDTLHTHSEDYEIASQISAYYGFALNQNKFIPGKYPLTMNDVLNISFYSKMGLHKQMHTESAFMEPRCVSICGNGGECVRSYWDTSEEECIQSIIDRRKVFPASMAPDLEKSVRLILNSAFSGIRKKFERYGRSLAPEDVSLNLYKETRSRYHFGRDAVEHYCKGGVRYSPLLDWQLHKLMLKDDRCSDKNLLFAVIFDRYHPELLSFKFEGGRSISDKTIDYARQINREYPYDDEARVQKHHVPLADAAEVRKSAGSNRNNKWISQTEVQEVVQRAFDSSRVENTFGIMFPQAVYQYYAEDVKNRKYNKMQNAYAVLGVTKVIQDVCANDNKHHNTPAEFLMGQPLDWEWNKDAEKNLKGHSYLEYYITARIDIVNEGHKTNNLEFVQKSDPNVRIAKPSWFTRKGQGYCLESIKGTLDLEVRCIGSGHLKIQLRGKDVRNQQGERIPFWIDYHALQVNGESCLEKVEPTWHDECYTFRYPVTDGETVRISIVWNPHNERENTANMSKAEVSLVETKTILHKIRDKIRKFL